MADELKHIELFAGCGGMTLGLETAGFELFMANELSPMAGETFAYNILGENLAILADEAKPPKNVLWVKSNHGPDKLKARLRENPFEYSKGTFSDINSKSNFSNKLVIGNIDHFLDFLNKNKSICRQIKNENIDLLSGGPPCQGFSLAGKRIKDDYKNLLPLSFVKFAGLIQPKVVMLENVKGITSPFITEDGVKHYAWLEVAKAFALTGFIPVCMLLNSKYFGVPQNRPRFILFAFRKDIFARLKEKANNTTTSNEILSNSFQFYKKVQSKKTCLDEIKISDITLYNIESNPELFDGEILPKLNSIKMEFITASQAIGDIISPKVNYNINTIDGLYAKQLSNIFKSKFTPLIEILQNHEKRNHSYKVKARFRLYQILNNLNGTKNDTLKLMSGGSEGKEVIDKVFNSFKKQELLVKSGEKELFEFPKTPEYLTEYFENIRSQKHSQRAIKENEPAPAQMTVPDDLCHYSQNELRTLTVREMARFQSFPDWFIFQSKITTGGEQRRFEVPQYTQVGNAVPPLLAFYLGQTISKLLNEIKVR